MNHLQDFVGRTMEDWGALLQVGAPSAPFVVLSNPRRAGGALRVDANRAEGFSYELWRTPSLVNPFWELVSPLGGELLPNTVVIEAPDAAAFPGFYRVEAVPSSAAQ